ncbi:uncharacterized protein LOC129826462 isoform X3 [Salvelinus fontinalis]|uniref:uncharacterized protein LOC129826462 isoform X3 n=1 Tax=Salvelinus fontinalis TaxID=8038 RepID=UPI0024850092|nr:uncharacterized protein LOC129826462 isoform X3 [Salvelinus fontinalis]
MARGGTECDSPVVHRERECHTMQKLKYAQETSTLPKKSHALPTCTNDDGPIVWGFSEERPINKIGKSTNKKWYINAELKQSLRETGLEKGVEEKASTANGESSGGNVEELKGDIAENEQEEKSDALVVQVEYVGDKASVEYREGDGLAPGGVEEVTEMAAEVEFEDGMRAEMKGGKGTDRYESGEEVIAERAVKRAIEEKDTEGKRILEKEHKVAPKRKNIRKRRRSAKPQRDKEANSSASFVETVLLWLLTVFLWWQAFSSRKFPLSVYHWNVSCIACKSPGCAAAVNKIWCGEDELLKGLPIPLCTSIPQKPKTACHHDGRAFVLMVKEVHECNMEYLDNYVSSEKTECPPLLEAIQGINSNNTLSPPPLNGSSSVGVIVASVLSFVGVIGVVAIYLIRQKHQGASRNQDEETEMSGLNNGTNQNGGPANRDNNEEVAVNMLESPLSHRQQ